MYAYSPHSSRFGAGLAANEKRAEPYMNTVKEHRNWQRRHALKSIGVIGGFAGKQAGVAWRCGEE